MCPQNIACGCSSTCFSKFESIRLSFSQRNFQKTKIFFEKIKMMKAAVVGLVDWLEILVRAAVFAVTSLKNNFVFCKMNRVVKLMCSQTDVKSKL